MAELKRNDREFVYYEVKGSGPPLVILRGLARSISHWLGYDEELSKYFKVIAVDNRGMGKSTAPHHLNDTIFDLAQDIADIIDEIGEVSAHILGVSLGGMVALAMGIKHPEKCRSIIAVNTSIAGNRIFRMSVPGIKVVLGGLVMNKDKLQHKLSNILVGTDFSSEEKKQFAKQLKKIFEEEGASELTAIGQIVAATRFRVKKQLPHMHVPTLIVYGGSDFFVPNINSKKIFNLLPNAEELEIAGAGHELFVDKGSEFLGPLQNWVARHN